MVPSNPLTSTLTQKIDTPGQIFIFVIPLQVLNLEMSGKNVKIMFEFSLSHKKFSLGIAVGFIGFL
jgi:hypothetical protein